MTSAAPIGKKPALCRYFMSSGSCVYGEDCQFLHQSPVAFQQNFQNTFLNGPPQHNGPIALPDNPGMCLIHLKAVQVVVKVFPNSHFANFWQFLPPKPGKTLFWTLKS